MPCASVIKPERFFFAELPLRCQKDFPEFRQNPVFLPESFRIAPSAPHGCGLSRISHSNIQLFQRNYYSCLPKKGQDYFGNFRNFNNNESSCLYFPYFIKSVVGETDPLFRVLVYFNTQWISPEIHVHFIRQPQQNVIIIYKLYEVKTMGDNQSMKYNLQLPLVKNIGTFLR